MTPLQYHLNQDAQVIERLTRVEEKLDSLLDRATLAAANTADHDVRIRNLETGAARAVGMGAVIAAIVGFLSSGAIAVASGGNVHL